MATATADPPLRAGQTSADVHRCRCAEPGHAGLIQIPEGVTLVTSHGEANSLSSYAAALLALILAQKYLRSG